jgi:hypothetical protein
MLVIGIVATALSPLARGANRERTRLFVVWPLGQVAVSSILDAGRRTSNWLLQGGQKYS